MPTYQYACTACDHRFEAVQAFSDAALTECPACAGRLRKVFSSVGVVFKGSGFYRTDSRASSAGATGNGAGKKSPDSTDSGSTGTASKPAASADSSSSSPGSTSSTGSSAKNTVGATAS